VEPVEDGRELPPDGREKDGTRPGENPLKTERNIDSKDIMAISAEMLKSVAQFLKPFQQYNNRKETRARLVRVHLVGGIGTSSKIVVTYTKSNEKKPCVDQCRVRIATDMTIIGMSATSSEQSVKETAMVVFKKLMAMKRFDLMEMEIDDSEDLDP